jgi:hypothetical protein
LHTIAIAAAFKCSRDAVLGINMKDEHSKDSFEEALEVDKEKAHRNADTELSANDRKELIVSYKQ